MKKRFTVTITPPVSINPDVYHSKTEVFIADNPEFEVNANYQKRVAVQNDLSDPANEVLDILHLDFILDFPRPTTVYYKYSVVTFSDGTQDAPSRIIKISQNGTSTTYQHSSTIIQTPVIIEKNDKGYEDEHTFVGSKFGTYLGNSVQHTSTSWKIVDTDGVVLLDRPYDSDNLTEITTRVPLKGDQEYVVTAIYHSGDITSNTGRLNLISKITSEDHYDIHGLDTANIGGKERLIIRSGVYNHAYINHIKFNFLGFEWEILDENGLMVLSSSSIPREITDVKIKPESLFISGRHLTADKSYKLRVQATFGTAERQREVVKEFDIHCVEMDDKNGILTRNKLTKLNLFTEHDSVVRGDAFSVCEGRKIVYVPDNDRLSRYFFNGDELKELLNSNDIFLDQKLDNSTTRTILTRYHLIVAYISLKDVEGYQGLVKTVQYRIYHYDEVNHTIFNPTEVVLSEVISGLDSELPITLASYRPLEYLISAQEDGKYVIKRLNLITGVAETLFTIGDITTLGLNKLPTISRVKTHPNYYIIVTENKTLLFDSLTQGLSEVEHIGDRLDTSKWMEVISKPDGEVYLFGISVNNPDVVSVFNFNVLSLRFELVAHLDPSITTDDGTMPTMNKPIFVTNNLGYISLCYSEKTYILN